MLNKLLFTAILAIFCISTEALAEDRYDDQRPVERSPFFDTERLFVGGGVGAGFGNYTYVNVSPIVGYFITDRFAVGLGGIYQYFNYRPTRFNTHVYGGRVFGRFYILEQLFAHAEYEMVNLGAFDAQLNEIGRVNVDALYLGGGYSQPMGRNSALFIMVLFDVIQHRYSFTQNPVIRMGFQVGF